MLFYVTHTLTNHYVQAVEGMQVTRSHRVSMVDAMGFYVGRFKRANPRRRVRKCV